MDVIALLYYALICAVLSFFAPRVRAAPARLLIGAVVGVAAAASLPMIRGLLSV